MKKLMLMALLIAATLMFSCEKERCVDCETRTYLHGSYDPVKIERFSLCDKTEIRYMNGKTGVYYDPFTKESYIYRTTCK